MKAIGRPSEFTLPESFVVPAIHQYRRASSFASAQGGVHAGAVLWRAVGNIESRSEEERVSGGVQEFNVIDRHQIGLHAGYRWKEARRRDNRLRDGQFKFAVLRHCVFLCRRHRSPVSLLALNCLLDGVECE